MTRILARCWLVPLGLIACQPALAQNGPPATNHHAIPHNEQGRTAVPGSMNTVPVSGNRNGQTCYANCDQSTTPPVLNVNDFACFLNHFAAGDTYANCDQSTTPPVLNVLDFSCFLNEFAAGCPG